jgi:POT family proton-dependent oligopeptide transporter
MATGQFLLASEHLFLVALVFLIMGNGFFKPNISTQVGNLYAAGDPRRDSAFMIFYMGVNLGAFL